MKNKNDIRNQRYEYIFDKVNKTLGTNKVLNKEIDYFDKSSEIWQAEFRDTGKDMEFYDLPEYLWGCLGSYIISSKTYVPKLVKAFREMGVTPKSILDYGAGIGLSTFDLADAFPDTTIYYYNISDFQLVLFNDLMAKFPTKNIVHITSLEGIDAEAVFCSEFFEHIKDPVPMAQHISDISGVKYIVEASSFKFHDFAGHYTHFIFDGKPVEAEFGQRMFNKGLRKIGFENSRKTHKVSCWNSRPNIWVKQETHMN